MALNLKPINQQTEEKEKQTTTSASLDRVTTETPAPKRKEFPFFPIAPARKY